MEAPKCSFCGKREWRHVCEQPKRVESPTAEVKSGGKKGKFDRVAYQREWMRRDRARKKALLEGSK